MSILHNNIKRVVICVVLQSLFLMPAFSLDLDSTVNDSTRQNYGNSTNNAVQTNKTQQEQNNQNNTPQDTQEIIQYNQPEIKKDLPKVPNLPSKANSSTVSPINTQYSGKVPNDKAFLPCNDIKIGDLIIDESVIKSKVTKSEKKQSNVNKTKVSTSKPTYRTATLAKGVQIRAVNQSKITDYMLEGQTIVFSTTQEIFTSRHKLPKGTKLTARIVSAHKPQLACNGGLIGVRIVSVNAYGYNQPINAGIIKVKTDRIHFSNLKGEHNYLKTTCKKAKWGQNMYKKWSKTSHQLASKGAGVIIAPFPYIGGCVLAAASTVSSPVTALLGRGGHLTIPANTTFTIKMYDDAKLRY